MNNPTQTPTPAPFASGLSSKAAPSFLIGPDFISIMVNGTPFTIYAADARYAKVLEVIKAKTWNKLESVINTAKTIALFTAGEVQVLDGVVSYAGNPVNNTVVNKILDFYKNGFPYEPLCRFLDKLMLNPSKWSTEQLYNYLERYKLPITDEGNFLGYKAVTSDFKDKYSRTVDNNVGANPKMPRNQCVDDHNIGCAQSFHLGNIDYVSSFGGGDDNVILVEVNPKDVVSCPIDCEYQKLRVCEYKVISLVGKVSDMKPFESEYVGNKDGDKTDDGNNDYSGGDMGDLDEGEAFIEDNEGNFPLIIPTGVHLTAISQERAYREHKAGNVVINHYDHTTIKPTDNKPRSFFRGNKSGWKMIGNQVSAPVVSPVIDKSQATKIGQNAAYEAHKNGLTVRNDTNGTVFPSPSPAKPRSFFRASTGWELFN